MSTPTINIPIGGSVSMVRETSDRVNYYSLFRRWEIYAPSSSRFSAASLCEQAVNARSHSETAHLLKLSIQVRPIFRPLGQCSDLDPAARPESSLAPPNA